MTYVQDFGDDGELHRFLYDQIFQFVQDEYPDNLKFITHYAPKAFDRQVNKKNSPEYGQLSATKEINTIEAQNVAQTMVVP